MTQAAPTPMESSVDPAEIVNQSEKKIFEVRRVHNDVTFIDEFLTEEFCNEQKLFTYEYNKQSGEWVIANREWKKVKEKLLFQLANRGQPFVYVEDGNYENRGELFLRHRHVDCHEVKSVHPAFQFTEGIIVIGGYSSFHRNSSRCAPFATHWAKRTGPAPIIKENRHEPNQHPRR